MIHFFQKKTQRHKHTRKSINNKTANTLLLVKGTMNDDNDDEEVDQITRRNLKKKVISILERSDKFPTQNRNTIDVLIGNFLVTLGDDVHKLLCDQNPDPEHYRGLDNTRDTEDEVETAIRFFPNVLSRKEDDEEDDESSYPIQNLSWFLPDAFHCNPKAAYFIPLLARLAIEFGLFEEQYRAGLLIDDMNGNNVLQYLTYSSNHFADTEHQQIVDRCFLEVLKQLRKLDLLKKEDIQQYDLLHFPESGFYLRFNYLVDWDPKALLHGNSNGCLPLHPYAPREESSIPDSTIEDFQLVFKAGIRYFPRKEGICILFRKDNDGDTPFSDACKLLGRDKTMKVIETTLAENSDNKYVTSNVLLSAAIDDKIHLDGLYFFLRREPDLLLKLLSMESTDNSSNNNDVSIATVDSRNRKRKRKKR
jgi:hypothetical protein